MSTRTVTGRLASDATVQKAGRMEITKFTLMENTGRYRSGEWVADDAATPHHVEAKFELGTAAAQLRKGDQVIVIGFERTNTWDKDGTAQFRRVVEADQIAVSVTNKRQSSSTAPQSAAEAPGWEVAPIGQAGGDDGPSAAPGVGELQAVLAAELDDARQRLTAAQAAGDEIGIKKWMHAVVDLEVAFDRSR
jgi:single-stranded DNA-binding protein